VGLCAGYGEVSEVRECVAGAGGFEPPYGGIKNPSTALIELLLFPNGEKSRVFTNNSLGKKVKLKSDPDRGEERPRIRYKRVNPYALESSRRLRAVATSSAGKS
jgi:hypothetical protein